MKREPTNQELLDRYIFSVKTLLPLDKARDIAAEIQSNLESLVEDQASTLGRDLSVDELSAILKQNGHPMVAASRYRERPFWGLSPELFRVYRFTLGTILALIFTIFAVKAAYVFPGRSDLGSFLFQFGREVVLGGIIVTVSITVIFAVWEYLEFKFRFWENWNPRSLAPVPGPIPPSVRQPRRVTQMIGQVSILVFLALALFYPPLSWIWGGAGHFDLSPAGYAMRLPLWLMAAFAISQSWLSYTRFASAEWRRFIRLAVYLAGVALAVALVRAGDLLVPGSNWDPFRNAASLATLNRMISGTSVLACILLSVGCVHELRDLMRRLGSQRQTG
ncbi:MAG: hypothetical protein ACRD5K_12620 [Candidatus Acidiferrales bacterium]